MREALPRLLHPLGHFGRPPKLAEVVVAVGEVVVRALSCGRVQPFEDRDALGDLVQTPLVALHRPPAAEGVQELGAHVVEAELLDHRIASLPYLEASSSRFASQCSRKMPAYAFALAAESGRPSASSTARSRLWTTSSPRPRFQNVSARRNSASQRRRDRPPPAGRLARRQARPRSMRRSRTAPPPPRGAAWAAPGRPPARARAPGRTRARRRGRR